MSLMEAPTREELKLRLQHFFYNLITNELPAGKVARLVEDLPLISDRPKFENFHIASYAEMLAELILDGE